MKITKLTTIPVERRSMILKMETDEGIMGFGEPMNYEHWRIVAQAVEDIGEYLVGQDPRDIERHWQAVYRSSYSRAMPSIVGAWSGIEMAMWDVMGKSLGLPVWKLLGGSVRNKVRVYTGIGGGSEPQQVAESAMKAVEQGYTALKMGGSPQPVRFVENPGTVKRLIARVAAVREAIGDDIDLAVDLHRRFSPTMAVVMVKELEQFGLLFAEEPCHPENDEPVQMIARSTAVPIATGERHMTRWGFRRLIEQEMCAILQPDIRHCGGIMELKKIANAAEIHNMAIAPHNAAGPIGVAASIHAVATIPNFAICEGGAQRGQGLFNEPLVFKDGYMELPAGPGLGVDMEDAAIESIRDESYKSRGMFYHSDDGSFADY